MNWLAHFALSSEDERERLGGWLPDLFPQSVLQRLQDPVVRRGMDLHRLVDRVTDCHPAVWAARAALPAELRRGGGIVLDVVWDHFLSREFPERMGRPLRPFVDQVLSGLEGVVFLAPPETVAVLQRMRREDWLGGYGTAAGVERALERISLRLSPRARRVLMPTRAADHLRDREEALRQAFDEIWRTVTGAVSDWREQSQGMFLLRAGGANPAGGGKDER